MENLDFRGMEMKKKICTLAYMFRYVRILYGRDVFPCAVMERMTLDRDLGTVAQRYFPSLCWGRSLESRFRNS